MQFQKLILSPGTDENGQAKPLRHAHARFRHETGGAHMAIIDLLDPKPENDPALATASAEDIAAVKVLAAQAAADGVVG